MCSTVFSIFSGAVTSGFVTHISLFVGYIYAVLNALIFLLVTAILSIFFIISCVGINLPHAEFTLCYVKILLKPVFSLL